MKKFSLEEEIKIANDPKSNRFLAKLYKVDKKTISKIRKRIKENI